MLVLMMIAAILIIGESIRQEMSPPLGGVNHASLQDAIPYEQEVFRRSNEVLSHTNMPPSEGNLDDYYENRAYPGAPPRIPHPLLSEKGIGGNACLQCHQDGGYVEQFKAYAPIAPHPTYENCRQCHVPKKTDKEFVKSDFWKIHSPHLDGSWLEGSPPVIPHTLQLRSNCLSCHASPSTPKEIRVSHPERTNCRQCHVPVNTNEFFDREAEKPAAFSRPLQPESAASQEEISKWLNDNEYLNL